MNSQNDCNPGSFLPVQSSEAPADSLVDRSGTIDAGVSAVAVTNGGTGYVVGDTLTLTDGVTLTVLTETASVISTVSITTPGISLPSSLPVNPTMPIATSGTGTGAVFTLTWDLGLSTQIMAVNPNRRRYRIQNLSTTEVLWLNDTGSAAGAAIPGSYGLSPSQGAYPGDYYEFYSVFAISVFGATPGHPFSAAEY